MSWRTDYRQGSFRGISFRTVSREQNGGRRGALHEFPQIDSAWREDLGRRARGFAFDCWIAGAYHLSQAQRLIDALESFGPGTLIDPFRGDMVVAVEDYSVTESALEGGISQFSIRFVETTGTPAPAVSVADTQAVSEAAAQKVRSDMPMLFGKKFDVNKLPAFVADAAAAMVEGAALLAQAAAAPTGGAGAVLRTFDAGLRLLPASTRSLIRTPISLGQAMVGMLSALSALSPNPKRRLAAARMMAGFGDGFKPVTGSTPPRLVQSANQEAFVALIRTVAVAEMIDALAVMEFSSYEDAAQQRAETSSLIDMLSLQAADSYDDDRWRLLGELNTAMVSDLTQRGATLARVYSFRPKLTEPALVIARRLYDATDEIGGRAEDIIARNALRHPGFVRGGTDLSILQEVAA